jgi:hypothetical protein
MPSPTKQSLSAATEQSLHVVVMAAGEAEDTEALLFPTRALESYGYYVLY